MSDIDQRVSELLLRVKADKQSAAQAKAEIASVAKAFDSVTDATKEVNRAIEATKKQVRSLDDVAESLNKSLAEGLRSETIDKVTQAYAELNREVGLTKQDVEDLAKALQDVGATDAEIQRVAQSVQQAGGAAEDASGGLGAGGRRVVSQGAALAGQLGLGDVARPLNAVTQFGDSIGALSTPLIAAASLVAAVGLAFKVVDDQLKSVKEQLTGALAAQTNYYQSLGKTTDQIKEEIAQRTQQQSALKQQIGETKGAIDSAFNQAVTAFGDPLARILDAAGKLPTAQLREQLDELNTQFTANGDTITRYRQGLEAGTYAINDAIEAEKALADARTKAALASGQSAGNAFAEDQQLLRGSVEQTQSALQKYSDQLGRNATEINSLIISGDQSAEVQARIKQLTDENTEASKRYTDILNNVLPVVQAVAAAEKELETARRTQAALESNLAKASQEYLSAQSTLDKALQQFADGAAKAASTLQAAFDKAEADRQAAIQKAQDDAAQATANAADQRNQAIANAEDKAAEDRLKAKEDYENRVKQIERQFQQDATNAVRSRDAVAFTQAKETRANDLKNAKDSYNKQLRDINRALKQQEKQIQQSYAAQLKTIKQNLDKQLQAAQDSYTRQVQAAQQSYDQQLTALQNNLNQANDIRDAAYQAEQTALTNFTNYVLSQADRLNAAASGTTTSGTTGTVPSFASGGYPQPNRIVRMNDPGIESATIGGKTYAVFSKPGRINSARQTAAMMGGGANVTINIQGDTLRKMKREMNRKFDEFAKGASQQYGFTP